jgi:hypothetical protein
MGSANNAPGNRRAGLSRLEASGSHPSTWSATVRPEGAAPSTNALHYPLTSMVYSLPVLRN